MWTHAYILTECYSVSFVEEIPETLDLHLRWRHPGLNQSISETGHL